MTPIKFKYIFSDGKEFKNTILTLPAIENGQLRAFTNNIPSSFKLVAVCQFTGEEDKNGVEIYNNDNVRVGNYVYEVIINISQGLFFKCLDHLSLRGGDIYFSEFKKNVEVESIGNKFENKELLEEGRCKI